MLFSLALMFIFGLAAGELCKRLGLPSLVGMLLTGVVLGPYCLGAIDGKVLDISSEIRQAALIIILMRAGLTLNLKDLKKIGRSAVMMCCVPACFEILGMVIIAPVLLGVSPLDGAIMGAVVAAVSPAVIVPRMIDLAETGYGVKKAVPQLILAGASVDDIFVIVLFSAFTGIAQGGSINAISLINIPVSVILGIILGGMAGFAIIKYFDMAELGAVVRVIILLSLCFIFTSAEKMIHFGITFSGLIGVMTLGVCFKMKREKQAAELSRIFNKLWTGAEVLLFALVGATVNLEYAYKAGAAAVLLILLVLVFRMAGVIVCLLGTNLNFKEKVFCAGAYIPKATVQAAIGGIPLSMGLECGTAVLTVAVLAILITAPAGAIFIDNTYKKLLKKD